MEPLAPLSLKYRFETDATRRSGAASAIEQYGNLACQIAQYSPSLIPYMHFGRAENIAGGLIEPGLITPQAGAEAQHEHLRIKSVEDASGPLIDYRYDRQGRIDEVVLIGSLREKYEWSNAGELIAVTSRDSEPTRLRYRDGGLLSTIAYPDNSLFRYSYGDGELLSTITYPDGVSVRFVRGTGGLLMRAECRDASFEYLRDDSGVVLEVRFQAKGGTWGFDAREIGGKLKVPFEVLARGKDTCVGSALGSWRYDGTGALTEMFVPTGVRLVKRSTDGGSQLLCWRPTGQTAYRFDKTGAVMGILNADGTHTVFKRLIPQRSLLMVSVMGVAALAYDEAGRLRCDRDREGRGGLYGYNLHGKLKSVSSLGQRMSLSWSHSNTLTKIEIGNRYRAAINEDEYWPKQATLACTDRPNFESAGTFTALVWDWQAMSSVRRLVDTAFVRGAPCV